MKEIEMYEKEDSIDVIGVDSEENIESTINSIISNVADNSTIDLCTRITKHGIPEKNWIDKYIPKFNVGDLIINKNGKSIYKVFGYDKYPNSYIVKKTESENSQTIDGIDFKKSPEGSEWKSYHDITDPLKVKGLKISCPSNLTKKA